MKAYKRKYPLFSLCGLNCGLCPRYQTAGASKCPGCGGPDFHLKHPTCAVISCNLKHDRIEHCYQCSQYPCERYSRSNQADSFITYKNVASDFAKAKKAGLGRYQSELDQKVKILEFLIADYNDGRRKNFYCLAVNLLSLPDLQGIMRGIEGKIQDFGGDRKTMIKTVIGLMESSAKNRNIELKLRT